MENDSPNLFDSEPMTVQLTVPADTADDVSAEIPEDVLGHADGGRSDEGNDDMVDGTEEVRDNAVEYHTDDDVESDDENVDLNDHRTGADQELGDDQPADQLTETEPTDGSPNATTKDVHKGLPLGRVKLIMKMDPDVNIVAADAVYILTKATESFVGLLVQHCHKAMVASNKKTLKRKHIEDVIQDNVPFEFLEDALDW